MNPTAMKLVETDSRSRVVLPGQPNRRFLVEELEDGSLRLIPAVVIPEAQLEYLTKPELRALLTQAAESPTVKRSKRARRAE